MCDTDRPVQVFRAINGQSDRAKVCKRAAPSCSKNNAVRIFNKGERVLIVLEI